ncbi:hypothetical protein C3F09_04245 [candidate division GN15 bacterium]|uniref:M23 family metallopeptidase n=1 Tax=candidate division GN15 bacterium TaxID=2072418 RepID=A0A855X845_9BACT|nr:MAG: hypothetical protein C3F09_04245 [candidate division GN15 bacterium]
MKSSTNRSLRVFILLILVASIGYAAGRTWPLKGLIDLSSAFGDYRTGRFHAGLDLRTGGVPGAQVLSPVDGYVWQVKMSYTGYGKGLYLKGNDGYVYVFGHLQRFAEKLDRRVKLEQMARKRYYVEIEFPADSIRVKAGELIAFSGQTGAGAPHLHFEKRTAGNFPLNPLTNGYPADDNVPPVIRQVGFQETDATALFESGRRIEMRAVEAKGGRGYVLDRVPYFNRPFGVLVDCYDQLRKDGPVLNVYRLNLYIDDKPWYETAFDTVDYATTNSANLEYDYTEAIENRATIRRLFRMAGDEYSGSRGMEGGDGTYGTAPAPSFGYHKARIEALDAAGNRSQLTFSFVWGPPENLYHLDTAEMINDSNWVFRFSPAVDTRPYGIDSAGVFLNQKAAWGPVPTIETKIGPDGRISADVKGYLIDRRVFRLALFTRGGCRIDEEPFNGIMEPGTTRIGVTHELNDDGLYVTIKAGALLGAEARLELYHQGKLLGVEYPSRYFNMENYHFFVPPREQYARVDLIKGILSRDTSRAAVMADTVNLAVVGRDDSTVLAIDSNATVIFRRSGLYQPRFIDLKVNQIRFRAPLKLNSDHYEVGPAVVALREPFEIRMRYFSTLPDSGRTGICRLDRKANRWRWINIRTDSSELFGTMDVGGSFAAVYDFDPPIISNLTPPAGDKVRDTRPKIQFTLIDSLSGIADDRNILIKLDGKWQIPEYDPETGICQTQPMEPLALGNHHVAVEVSDRVGNKAAQYLQFTVAPPYRTRTKR